MFRTSPKWLRRNAALPLFLLPALLLGNGCDSGRNSAAPVGQPLLALTAGNSLVRISSGRPGTTTGRVAITGLAAGESLQGIDFRPANGQLFGLGSSGRLYTIDITTGAATAVGAAPFVPPLVGTNFGFDFNPVPDQVRIVSDADQNLRVNPDTGAVADNDANAPGVQPDGTLAYAAGDVNAGADPNIVAAAYTNSVAGATTTTLYGIDSTRNVLVIQNPPNAGVLNTVGPLNVDVGDVTGFDIAPGSNTAFAVMTTGSGRASSLYVIDLTTGAAAHVGVAAGGEQVRGLAVLPPSAP